MTTQLPVEVVGGNSFGRYKKISDEKTFNLFTSDGWLVSFAGYKNILEFFDASQQGRALFHSVRGQFLIAVVANTVFKIEKSLLWSAIGTLDTSHGEVYIDENLSSQICIVDGLDAYIYNWALPTFVRQNISVASGGFTPGYVSYHNTFFLLTGNVSDPNPQTWRIYQYDVSLAADIVNVPPAAGGVFALQTKPDFCVAAHRLPGRANHIIIFGSIVCEVWTHVGGAQNYRRNASFNIDSGCVSRESIAVSEQFVCWLAQNESSQRTIMMTDGSEIKPLSTDGIDNLLKSVQFPQHSSGFFFRQDGHLFYQLTFYNEVDPFTLVYDFNTGQFIFATDQKLNSHPARQVAYFNNKLYFISLKNGALYETSTDIIQAIDVIGATTGDIIPRLRICKTLRTPDSTPFRSLRFSFVLEQGFDSYYPLPVRIFGQLVDENGTPIISEGGALILSEDGYQTEVLDRPNVEMSISKNGCATFSNKVRRFLNHEGQHRNTISWDNLGFGNEFTIMLQFNGLQRFVVANGILTIDK